MAHLMKKERESGGHSRFLFLKSSFSKRFSVSRSENTLVVVRGFWGPNPYKPVLDALRGVAFEDDAGESPDFFEMLARYQ